MADPEVVVTPDESDADFDSGFAETETKPVEPTTLPEAAPEPVAAIPEKPTLSQEKIDELLSKVAAIDEIKANHQRLVNDSHGRIGALKQQIDALQNKQQSKVELTPEDFADIAQDYPELAGLQLKSMQKIVQKMSGVSRETIVDTAALEVAMQSRLDVQISKVKQDIEQANEMKRLNKMHPDYKDTFSAPDFQAFISAQPQAEQNRIMNLWDADDLSKVIVDYKKSKAPPPKKAAVAPITSRKELLQAAVTPTGAGGITPSKPTVDEFDEGFRTARL